MAGRQVIVKMEDREVLYDFSDLDELALAYAVSVHKFQGSECPCVVMPVHTQHFKLLHRNLLYTGVTRGKKMVVLVGTTKALSLAVRNDEVKKRFTGLRHALMDSRSNRFRHTMKSKKTFILPFRNYILSLCVFLIFLGFYWAAGELTYIHLPDSNSPPRLYANQVQDDLELTFSTAIDNAKKSVLLMIYNLTDPKVIQSLKHEKRTRYRSKSDMRWKGVPKIFFFFFFFFRLPQT